MTLVARALKAVEGNKSTFGIYLPTLFGLRHHLNAIKPLADMFLPLITELEVAFEARFGNVMDKYDAVGEKMNSMGFPVIPSDVRRFVKTIMLNACRESSKDMDKDSDDTEEGASSTQTQSNGNLNALVTYWSLE